MDITNYYDENGLNEEKLPGLVKELMSDDQKELQTSYTLIHSIDAAKELAEKLNEVGGSRACARMARLYFSALSIMEKDLVENAIDEIEEIVKPSNEFLQYATNEEIDEEVRILMRHIREETATLFTNVLKKLKNNPFAETYTLMSF